MKIPAWKIKREARRLLAQVQQIPWILFSSRIRKRFDENALNVLKYHSGKIPLLQNVAILLIFQPEGVSPSTFVTLKHLISNGFSPVVVTNAALLPDDLQSLKQCSYVVIERPNFGYDFGGYRDAVRHLLNEGIIPENLLIVNDSIWFPIYPDCTFLEELKRVDTELFGLVINDQYENPARHHIQSYMFNFKKSVVSSDDFKHYWDNLFLSNNKNAVIRQCEIKMTNYFHQRGFSTGSKYKLRDIYSALKTVDAEEFETIVNYQMEVDPKRIGFLKDYKNGNQASNKEYLIDKKLLGKYFLISHPYLLIKHLRFPCLKRDRQYIYQIQREEIFTCNLEDNLLSVVHQEIEARGLRKTAVREIGGFHAR